MQDKIKTDIVAAMRAKDSIRLETLRGLSALFQGELLKKAGATALTDDEVTALIRRAVKQRKDSIDQFTEGGRADLAAKEQSELAILESYLPKLMPREDIRKFVDAKIAGGATLDKAKAGQFTGMIMKELKGKADGADVKAVIDQLIG